MRMVKIVFGMLAVLGTCNVSARAQTASSATVLGRVTDPGSAVVAGAQVTLRNVATNAARDQMTNSDGQYTIPDVAPGSYTLTVKKEGFQTSTVANLQFSVNKGYSVDVPLKIGALAEVVQVSASAVELQTTDAQIGDVIGGSEILRLPTLTRSASELLTLQPGATPTAGGGDTFSTTGGTVSGARSDQNAISLDGIDITDNAAMSNSPVTVIPINVDTIAEFRVGVANPNATFGRAAGGQVSTLSRAGTNEFHGDVYWYVQNTVFNANSWDNNHTPITDSVTGLPTGKFVSRPTIRDNRGGFSLGGPLKKNKTFFFTNFEPRRFFQSVQGEHLVPSQNLRNGIINIGGTLYNLKTSTVCGPNANQPCDPRGIGISPTVQALWNLLPQGNDPTQGDGVNILGYKYNAPAPLTNDSVSFRLDHKFGSNLNFFGRYAYSRLLNPAGENQVDLRGASNGTARLSGKLVQLGDGATTGVDWIIRSNLINSTHFGWIRSRQNNDTIKASALAAQYNLPGTNSTDGPVNLLPGHFGAPFAPNLVAIPVDSDGVTSPRGKEYGTSIQLRDDLNWIKGTHTFAFGGDVRWLPFYYQADDKVQSPRNSLQAILDAGVGNSFLSITNAADAPPGHPANWDHLYAAALGLVDSTSVTVARDANLNPLPVGSNLVQNARSRAYYFYGQDTWRIRPSLTLSYGLAYGWQAPPTESQGKMTVLVDASGKPIDGQKFLQAREAAALQGQIYNPTFGYVPYGKLGMSGAWNTDYGDIAPRVSLAWNPSAREGFLGKLLGAQKTVIRGGYGISYDRTNLGNITNAVSAQGFFQSLILPLPGCNNAVATPGAGCNGSSSDPVVSTFRIGVDGQIPVPPHDTQQTLPFVPGVNGDFLVFVTDPNFKTGRAHLIDFSIQRELPKNMLLEIGYVGHLGRQLPNSYTLSQSPYMFVDKTTLAGAAGSGQSFAQAFDNVATALRGGASSATLATQPWFENQLPAGFGNGCGPGGANLSNTQCIASQQTGNFVQGSAGGIFQFANSVRCAGQTGICPLAFFSQQQADLEYRHSHDISNYHALVATLRNRGWQGLTFDMNYTFSKVLDQEGRVQVFINGYVNSFNPRASYGPAYSDRTHVYNALFNYDLPFGKGRQFSSGSGAINRVIGGWYISGIFRAMSGVPLVAAESPLAFGGGIVTSNNVDEIPTASRNAFQTGLHSGATGSAAPCAAAFGSATAGSGSSSATGGTGLNYFADPGAAYCMFRPLLLASDTASGRGSPLRGFGSWNLDARIGKETSITEKVKVEISADLFNIFNHVTFNDPGVGGSASFMDITSPASFGVISSQFVPGNRLAGSRWVQFGVRVSF
jgi:hypothetical protein